MEPHDKQARQGQGKSVAAQTTKDIPEFAAPHFTDKRPEAVIQQKWQQLAENSPTMQPPVVLSSMQRREIPENDQLSEYLAQSGKQLNGDEGTDQPFTAGAVVQRVYLYQTDGQYGAEAFNRFTDLVKAINAFRGYLYGPLFKYRSSEHAEHLNALQNAITQAIALYKTDSVRYGGPQMVDAFNTLSAEKNQHFKWFNSNDPAKIPAAEPANVPFMPPPQPGSQPSAPKPGNPDPQPFAPKPSQPPPQPSAPKPGNPDPQPFTSRRTQPDPQTSGPTTVSSPPAPVGADQGEVSADPLLRAAHQPRMTRVIEAGSPVEYIDSGKGFSFQNDFVDPDCVPDNRSKHVLKAGKVTLFSLSFTQRKETNLTIDKKNASNYTIKEGTVVEVEKPNVSCNNISGCVIKFKTQEGQYHWANNDSIGTETQEGYQFAFNGKTCWAPSTSVILKVVGGRFVEKLAPLFPDHPNISQVKQGRLGNCYLMGALASIMLKDADFPRRIMTDHKDRVTVMLFDVRPAQNAAGFTVSPKPITILKSVAEDDRGALYARDHLWVQMLEKAYAAGGFTGNLLQQAPAGAPSYGNIASGNARHAFRVLLGQDAKYISVEEGSEIPDLFTQIRAALKADQPVTLGSKEFETLPLHKKERASRGVGMAGEDVLENIVLKHVYSVINATDDGHTRWLIVRNPWGGGGTELVRGNQGENEMGELKFSMGNLKSYFDSITIGPVSGKL